MYLLYLLLLLSSYCSASDLQSRQPLLDGEEKETKAAVEFYSLNESAGLCSWNMCCRCCCFVFCCCKSLVKEDKQLCALATEIRAGSNPVIAVDATIDNEIGTRGVDFDGSTTLLLTAIARGNMPAVESLLKAKACPGNEYQHPGRSPLVRALTREPINYGIANLLVQHGAYVGLYCGGIPRKAAYPLVDFPVRSKATPESLAFFKCMFKAVVGKLDSSEKQSHERLAWQNILWAGRYGIRHSNRQACNSVACIYRAIVGLSEIRRSTVVPCGVTLNEDQRKFQEIAAKTVRWESE